MQRIRAGLTGLACVFLIVLLAAAFLNIATEKRSAADRAASGAGNATTSAEPPRDPLAELGVAPDAAPEKLATPAATAPHRTPAAR